MKTFWLNIACLFFLSGCVLKGTDSGNPGAVENSSELKLCLDEANEECAQDNPAVYLIDQGLCQSLDRCGSMLRSADCRIRALNSNVLPEVYGDAGTSTSREFAIRVGDRKIAADEDRLRSCVQTLTAKACAQLPPVPDQSSESFRITFRTLLTANSECAEIFK